MLGYFKKTLQAGRFGYVHTNGEAESAKELFEKSTSSRFVVLKSNGNFGKKRRYDGSQVVQWDRQHRELVPFIHIGNKIYECHRGKDWKAKMKLERKKARIKETMDNPDAKKMRFHKGTKKAGCTARIVMREVMKFPTYEIDSDTAYKRKVTSSRLKQALKNDPSIGERRIYIQFPRSCDHHGHDLDDSDRDNLILDPRIVARIHELKVNSQVQTIAEMKFLLKEFVTDVLCKDEPLPHKKDRRFFPTVLDIRKVLQKTEKMVNTKSALVIHCKENIPDLHIRIIDETHGKFEVWNKSCPEKVYIVDFCSDGQPSCSCSDWMGSKQPCEHFRAVFHQTSWDLEKLPEEFRGPVLQSSGNEYFVATLTMDSSSETNDLHKNGDDEMVETVIEEIDSSLSDLEDNYETISGGDSLETLRLKCRDQLKRIEDLTHLVKDEAELSQLLKTLHESKRNLEELAEKN